MIRKGDVQEILRIANGKSTISTSAREYEGIPIETGNKFSQAAMGSFVSYEWQVVGFISPQALAIYECNQPDGEGVLLRLENEERYDIRGLREVALLLKDRRERGKPTVNALG